MKKRQLAVGAGAVALLGVTAVAGATAVSARPEAQVRPQARTQAQTQTQTQARAGYAKVQIVVGPTSESGKDSAAVCPDGMAVLNGGFQSRSYSKSGGGEPYDAIIVDAPTKDGKGWWAQELHGQVQARAVCVPQGEAPQVVVGPVSGENSDSDAYCPSGTAPVGGGFVARSWYKNGWGESQDDTLANAPTASGSGWFARLFAGKVEARALCA
ncbi:hypothetical protein [Streptomyces sp. NPDC101249]|uniref:hypothetical protein n=1 Tax=Streptomyces sp. NPDC101249 TaxID=3366140 RepID=UPI003809B08A